MPAEQQKTQKKKSFWKEFREFIKEYQIIGLALAVVMGGASQALVKSLVDNILMPIVTVALPKGSWQQATFDWGPLSLRWGAFSGEFLNFVLLSLVVFFIAKKLLKEDTVAKK